MKSKPYIFIKLRPKSNALSLYAADEFDDMINKSLQLNWHTICIDQISHTLVFA